MEDLSDEETELEDMVDAQSLGVSVCYLFYSRTLQFGIVDLPL
jgi:hypothetical protein